MGNIYMIGMGDQRMQKLEKCCLNLLFKVHLISEINTEPLAFFSWDLSCYIFFIFVFSFLRSLMLFSSVVNSKYLYLIFPNCFLLLGEFYIFLFLTFLCWNYFSHLILLICPSSSVLLFSHLLSSLL